MDDANDDDVQYKADIDAMCSDYVQQAQLIHGATASDASRLLFVNAMTIATECAEDVQIVMIECQSRDHLVGSIRDENIADPAGLDKIVIKHAPSFAMLRALLSAWHCDLGVDEVASDAKALESSFLIWDGEDEHTPCRNTSTPDYMFIDGIHEVVTDQW
ncbi:hypothetical protein GGI21_002828 [Coemansia aciculifera]|nr:hypothetical protein GGI21_002828 [Coemansia aciculifera]